MLLIAVFAAGSAQAKEKSLFSKYLSDRTTERFVAAFNHYELQRADTVNHQATIILVYLYMMEMNRNLDMLKADCDNLSSKQKFQYANIMLELEKYDDAIEIYKKLNTDKPKWSCPWRHRGEAHWKNGELDEAVASLEKSIETRETHYDAYIMLADVLADMEKYEKALNTLEKGLTYYGKDIEDPEEEVNTVDMNFLYLDLLERNGKIEKAAEIREKLEGLVPDDERLKK